MTGVLCTVYGAQVYLTVVIIFCQSYFVFMHCESFETFYWMSECGETTTGKLSNNSYTSMDACMLYTCNHTYRDIDATSKFVGLF